MLNEEYFLAGGDDGYKFSCFSLFHILRKLDVLVALYHAICTVRKSVYLHIKFVIEF